MSKPLPEIKIGTLAERLAASAAVPLEQAIAGVRAHGPQPTRPNPSLVALKHFQSSMSSPSPTAPPSLSTEMEPSTMPSLIPSQAA
jgi:hypothetical protein